MKYAPDPMIWMTVTTASVQRRRELHLLSCHVANRELNKDLSLTASFRKETVACQNTGWTISQ